MEDFLPTLGKVWLSLKLHLDSGCVGTHLHGVAQSSLIPAAAMCLHSLTISVVSSLNVCTGKLEDTAQGALLPDAILNCQPLLFCVMQSKLLNVKDFFLLAMKAN